MKTGNLEELRARLSWVVDFNATQTDQDFRGRATNANEHIDNELNLAYRREVNEAKLRKEMSFLRKHSFTWTASATTLAIPAGLKNHRVLELRDSTDSTPGTVITLGDDETGFYVYDVDTWGWNPAPSSARTLVASYIANPTWMEAEADEPLLIPIPHRELLVWSAAINMHKVAPITDSATYQQWVADQDKLQFAWHKELARGSPSGTPPAHIRNTD